MVLKQVPRQNKNKTWYRIIDKRGRGLNKNFLDYKELQWKLDNIRNDNTRIVEKAIKRW